MKKDFFLGVALTALLLSGSAFALANTLGRIKAWQISCDGTAKKISPAGSLVGYQAFRLVNFTSTPVYLGDSAVDTSTAGYPVCTDTATCGDSRLSVDAQPTAVFCRTGGSSVTLTILGGAQ